MTGGVRIRLENMTDRTAIHEINEQAFGRTEEAGLVEQLRSDGDLVLSLVAEEATLVGHVAFSRLTLAGQAAARIVALGPIAVLPEWQRRGVGRALIQDGLARLKKAQEQVVLVLGDSEYYRQFGFSADQARGFETPYDGPYLHALLLAESGDSLSGRISYPRAFAGLT